MGTMLGWGAGTETWAANGQWDRPLLGTDGVRAGEILWLSQTLKPIFFLYSSLFLFRHMRMVVSQIPLGHDWPHSLSAGCLILTPAVQGPSSVGSSRND